jgi:Cache 3/Cache 2 fusion domain
MRQDNSRGQNGMRRAASTGRTGDTPTVSVSRIAADPAPMSGARGSGEHAARMRRSVQRGWRRLGFRRQFVMLLVAATLLSTLSTVAAAYLGARVVSISNAQSRIKRDLQVADQVVAAHGPAITVQAGQLYTADGFKLNSDDMVVNQMASLTGDATALFQLENHQLVDIAGNITGGRADADIGQPLAGLAAQNLISSCTASQKTPCAATYSGIITLQGTSYIAGLAPLDDGNGRMVGALGVVTPLAAIEAPLRQLAGLLLLVGLLLTAIFIVIGYRISGPVSRRAVTRLSRGLDDVSAAAGQMEKMSRRQTARSEHQVAAAHDIVAELRKLSDLAEALEQGTNMLRESTGQLWAEMSYPAPAAPGGPAGSGIPNGSPAMRQTAVAASQIGAAAGQARVLCHGLRTRLNQIIAEAGLLSSESQNADAYIEALASAIGRVEDALDSHPASSGSSATALGFWRDLLPQRSPAKDTRASFKDDDDDGMTRSGQAFPPASDASGWTGRTPPSGRISHMPRGVRTGHTSPRLNARNTGAYRALPHHSVPSNPHLSGSHPSVSGRRRVPWYSDEQDLAGAFQESDPQNPAIRRDDPPTPPSQQSGSWRKPSGGPQPGPRPSDWMNDLL